MPRDLPLVADTKAWLQKARNDLRGAEIDLAAAPPLLDDTLFHCQRALDVARRAYEAILARLPAETCPGAVE